MKAILFASLGCLLFLVSCSSSKSLQQKLYGAWKLEEINGQKTNPNTIEGNLAVIFFKDGTGKSHVEKMTWKLIKNESGNFIEYTPDRWPDRKSKEKILTLDDKVLELEREEGEYPAIFKFKRLDIDVEKKRKEMEKKK